MERFAIFIGQQPVDGPPFILVTHQVNVQAITGRLVASGEGVWVDVASLQARFGHNAPDDAASP